ncbi:MAG: 3-deoxy-manno-octulosonate cytidylyltransferase [Saprospiraceae bacterium]
MTKNNKSLGIIPARYGSSRFPGKPLADIGGKPMIQWVYEKALQSELDEVVVATDDQRILEAVEAFGGKALMTASTHSSGTDRCAEVAAMTPFSAFSFVVNIQGDEPGIDPALINAVLEVLRSDEKLLISTLASRIQEPEQVSDPNVVKAVFDRNQKALYFSRSSVPFVRNDGATPVYYRHIGLYAFRRNALLQVAQMEQSSLERAEQLEQLRWLENGIPIGVAVVAHSSIAIDTPADLEKFKKHLK